MTTHSQNRPVLLLMDGGDLTAVLEDRIGLPELLRCSSVPIGSWDRRPLAGEIEGTPGSLRSRQCLRQVHPLRPVSSGRSVTGLTRVPRWVDVHSSG